MPPDATPEAPPVGRLRNLGALCLQVAFLSLLFGAWLAVGRQWRLPLPPGLVSMLTLLALLMARVVPLASVQRGAAFLLRYIGLLFVPICVGAVRQLPLLRHHAWAYAALIVAGALVSMGTAGVVAQALCRKPVQSLSPEGFTS
jgi:holin-like protein